MTSEVRMIPALQVQDLEQLEAASKDLETHGFSSRVVPFGELAEDDHLDWMTPTEGGYLLFVEEARFAQAMERLGDFFGYEG
jgi:hypothetical protein